MLKNRITYVHFLKVHIFTARAGNRGFANQGQKKMTHFAYLTSRYPIIIITTTVFTIFVVIFKSKLL